MEKVGFDPDCGPGLGFGSETQLGLHSLPSPFKSRLTSILCKWDLTRTAVRALGSAHYHKWDLTFAVAKAMGTALDRHRRSIHFRARSNPTSLNSK